ncbi:aminoacyl-tRNA hydrolase [Streptomyces rapamycinicus]|uniref:Peptidyl-tRNA hydrolase n=2 Tax=Streptomyces rapamycinicus TaxID=1226757 RepID=A0A0A0NEQ6_STRRN|nr:aminoacyl-tRNA hydrolase [Streptomyces rapamycinicus]AGP55474.1 peptidyl-tRNA hydrolase [Streptomyces rapamycinicus NRRL 5491]MBB4783034.1 PTH1 family peptidyl-tRNA hydrolase [Streptomyces rapamycinicus]RLV81491.1 peptidyl-tRNA hydrolase [Streptomyces rapamycinicus NRRL 5491]UTO63479.1 aminoacyl-tRNA hydrolase [Streptomyces rapamycinicus]UTP31436.1 aminoacyl-tRNA hydrolase [Streptomyces rapamycinicus NRRL 5491]
MTDDTSPWLVVGLGNPGGEYAGNRHNVGFMVADLLAERMGARFKAHKSRAQVIEGRVGPPGPASRRVVIAKPMSFMNLSGGPVTALRDFYKVPVGHVVAVHDELDIDYGALRLKIGGGDNGHNGLKSITKSLGADYLRVRFGIGRPPGRMDVAAFVLKDFSAAERRELDYFVDRAADAVETLIADGLERAQGTYNS